MLLRARPRTRGNETAQSQGTERPVQAGEQVMHETDAGWWEHVIDKVTACKGGWEIAHDHTCFFVSSELGVIPKVGQTARFWADVKFGRVRGLALDGKVLFYRTREEDKVKAQEDLYGATCEEWLRRWDANEIVHSVSMGGMGPGYEQCIQVTAAEILRLLLRDKPKITTDMDEEVWKKLRDDLYSKIDKVRAVSRLGRSGAQVGAAMSLATLLYMRGPIDALTDEKIKDRHIQVRKRFP